MKRDDEIDLVERVSRVFDCEVGALLKRRDELLNEDGADMDRAEGLQGIAGLLLKVQRKVESEIRKVRAHAD